jgi:hypothetical protein
MPTIPLSINGVPYTDTYNFLREAQSVIERDVNNVFAMLVEFSEMTDDDNEDLRATQEPIRVPDMKCEYDWYVRVSRKGNKVRRDRERAKECK